MIDEEEIIDDYQDCLPLREIYAKHKINLRTLRTLLDKNGISQRSRNSVAQRRRIEKSGGKFLCCAVCGRRFLNLSIHIKVHNLTPELYAERYNSQLVSQITHEKMSNSSKRKYEKNPQLKEKLREIGRKNIRKVNESGQGWRMPKGYHTEEHKQRMSVLLKGRKITWADKIRKSHWSKSEKAQEIIDKMIRTNSSWRSKRGWYTSTKTGIKEYYHSSYELQRMQELDNDDEVVNWTKKHGITISYHWKGSQRKYVPDFLIEFQDSTKLLEEVKGYVNDRDQYDLKCSIATVYCQENDMTYRVNFMKQVRNG